MNMFIDFLFLFNTNSSCNQCIQVILYYIYIVMYVLDGNKNIYFVRNKILQHRHVDK